MGIEEKPPALIAYAITTYGNSALTLALSRRERGDHG
jgi:hypothetical protein